MTQNKFQQNKVRKFHLKKVNNQKKTKTQYNIYIIERRASYVSLKLRSSPQVVRGFATPSQKAAVTSAF